MTKDSLFPKNPIRYMDRLLGSRFFEIVSRLPNAQDIIQKHLVRNRNIFAEKTSHLHPGLASYSSVYTQLQQRITNIETELQKLYGNHSPHTMDGLGRILDHTFSQCPQNLKRGLYLTEQAALSILRTHPPLGLMRYMECSTPGQLFRKRTILDTAALSRHSENAVWQEKYKKLLAQCTLKDFEQRPIRYILIDAHEYRNLLAGSMQPQKPWRVSHSKEAGVITCFAPDNRTTFRVGNLQYVAVFLHYFFETAYASLFYTGVARHTPNALGQAIVNSITNHGDKFPFFYPNLYSENLFWKKALELFHTAFPIEDAKFFTDSLAHGEYLPQSSKKASLISLHFVDHIWDVNFAGNHAVTNSFKGKKYATRSFSYHFRQELWRSIFQDLVGLNEEKMDRAIIDNLGIGDVAFTNKLISAVTI